MCVWLSFQTKEALLAALRPEVGTPYFINSVATPPAIC